MPGLAESILDQHRRNGRARLSDLRPAHVLLGPDATRFVLPLVDSLDPGTPIDVPAIAWTDRDAGAGAALDESRELFEVARALRVPFVPAVAGACEAPFREALAAPGRFVVTCGIPDVALGALGLLACDASPLEAVALLRGLPGWQPPERRARVALVGSAIAGVEGVDAALELLRRIPPPHWAGARLECEGDGARSLPLAERIAFAHLVHTAAAAAVLFPSDDETREAFRAWKRDTDWRDLHAEEESNDRVVSLDLAFVEPLVAPWSDLALARDLRQVLGRTVRGVILGPLADETDFARFASLLDSSTVAPGVEAVAVPGSAGLWSALEATGVAAALRAAGVRVVDPAEPWEPPRRALALHGTWIGIGLSHSMSQALPGVLVGSTSVCAAAARVGALTDPRDQTSTTWQPVRAGVSRGEFVCADPVEPAGAPRAASIRRRPVRGSLRAVVWIEAGDDCSAERVLPRAARRRAGQDSDAAVLPWTRREDLPAGPEAHLVLVAGRALGCGGGFDEAAWALSRAGVRVVIAASIEADATRSLAYAGVLPLVSTRRSPRDVAAPGEEIEIPSLPEAVEPGLLVGVRNLTRGVQDSLRHALDARLVAIWRGGGLLGSRSGSA